MKRLLVLSAAVVLGVLLGGFTLVGHTATTKAAGPITINMSSYPLEPASGVTGTTIIDAGAGPLTGLVVGTSVATGINPVAAFYPTIGTFFYTGTDCNPTTLVAILIHNPGGASQTAFLFNGVTLGSATEGRYGAGTANVAVTTTATTLTDTRLTGASSWIVDKWVGAVVTSNGQTMTVASNTANTLTGAAWSADPGQGNAYTIVGGTLPAFLFKADFLGPYTGGLDSIGSAGLTDLTGYNPASTPPYKNANLQYFACGNVGGAPVVSPYGGNLRVSFNPPGPPYYGTLNTQLDTQPPVAGDRNGDTVLSALDVALEIDADLTTGTPCNPVNATATKNVGSNYNVAICLTSSDVSPDGEPAAFNFDLVYDDTLNQCVPGATHNDPDYTGDPPIPQLPCAATDANCLDYNPDANAGGTLYSTPGLGSGYDCTGGGTAPPSCDVDTATGALHGRARLSCTKTSGTPTLPVGPGVSSPVAIVAMKALLAGSDALTLDAVSATNPGLSQYLICPGGPGLCFGATETKQVPPPATATNTNTPIPPTNTPGPTNTPVPGVRMEKLPANANLWLMKGGCVNALEGKGCLEIDVWVYGIADVCDMNVLIGGTPAPFATPACVPEGLGAWEHQIRFDHKFISITPVPDNTWLQSTGRIANCTMQIVSEDNILEGCITKTNPAGGVLPGPEGSGLIERIYVIPNINDLVYRSDFRPTKDNGIVVDIVDDNCEVTDTYGEQIPGTLPGQLTVVCGDAHITIRFLEGDTNLDCQITVLDDQAQAFRYGSHLGLQLYDRWYDLEPKWSDDDIDIKDLQFVFGRNYSTCQNPIPNDQGVPVPPIDP